jgi:hypothetical protein
MTKKAETAETVDETVEETTSLLSKATYNSSYVIAYGITFPIFFIIKSLPNPIMHGLIDGAKAANDAIKLNA